MLLLSTDTSGRNGSIALARCGPGKACEVLEVVPLEGGTFSAQLVPQIAALLVRHGSTKDQLDAFAVASGPGSFTGLRVGLAAIKALAEVLHKPIAAVSLLEGVAVSAGAKGNIIAALDAGRGEVYVGEYEVGETAKCLNERLISANELPSIAGARPIVTPDKNVAGAARAAGLSVEEIARPDSGAIADLGWQKILAGEILTPEALEANYIRRSDEIFSKPGSLRKLETGN